MGAGIAVPAAADQMLASVPPVFSPEGTLSAYHGLIVIGGRTFAGPDAFFAASGGAATRLPIRVPRLGDIDLGPGRQGGTEAVYERCPGDPDSLITEGLSGCDIY